MSRKTEKTNTSVSQKIALLSQYELSDNNRNIILQYKTSFEKSAVSETKQGRICYTIASVALDLPRNLATVDKGQIL